MRDRIVFFILGAVLATVAYFVGDMNKAGAQDGETTFDGNVLINGTLIVAGGSIQIQDNPHLMKNVDELESLISIVADHDGAAIALYNGPSNETDEYASNIVITARTTDRGSNYSAMFLLSDYDRNRSEIWGMKELNRHLFKDLE